MDFKDAIRTFVKRDKSKYITHSNNNTIYIVNSINGAVYPVTKYCDCTILTQSFSLITSTTVMYQNKNLSSPSNLLSIMSTNGKEDTKMLSNVL